MLLHLLFLIYPILAGTIEQVSITNTIANKDQRSDYTFILIPETTVPAGGILQIIFPIQYKANLGAQAYCTNCLIDLHVVTFYFTDPILSVANTFIIYNVLNPDQRGGTGNFIIRTSRHEFIYDENLIFPPIGIADTIDLLSSCLISTADSPTAGALSKYNFAFKTNTDLPKGTTIQLFIPKVYTISLNPSCNLYPINGLTIEGNVLCTRLTGNKIQVSGFSNQINSGQEVGIQVSLSNPLYSQVTDKFSIAAYRQGTSVIYTWKSEINSVQILPGLIQGIALNPLQTVKQVTGKIMDYKLTFLPTNPLPDGAIIKVIFPSTFKLVIGALQYAYLKGNIFIQLQIEGLDDISEQQQLKISITQSELSLSNFNATTARTIIIYFRAQNPSDAGPTEPMTIRTYTDSTLQDIIDENNSDAKTTIISVASLNPRQVGTTPSPAESQSQSIDLQFTIYPTIVIPGNAIIKVLLDDSFTVGTVSNINCLANTLPITYSLYCNKSDNLITWQNPNTIQYNTNLPSYFGINGLIQTPIYARDDYLVDIEIYNSAGIILQSYSDYISIQPKNIKSTSTVTMLAKEYSTATTIKQGIFIAQFQNEIIIPEGGYDSTNQKSYARIEFWFGSSLLFTEFDTKLGTTINDGGIIPCKAIDGLIPIDNLKIQCNLQYGTATSPPKVIVRNFKEIPYQTKITIHIPGIQTPIDNTIPAPATISKQYQIKLVQYDYRWRTVLNIVDPTILLQFVAQVGAVPGAGNTLMPITNFQLSGIFNISMKLQLGNDLLPSTHFLVKLPGYDTMFVPWEDTVVCYIDTYLTPCISYPGIDWILLYIQSTHYYALAPTLYLYNLVWPRYQDSIGYVQWVIIQNNVELEIKTLKYTAGNLFFPPPVVNDFDDAQILSPKKGKGFVGLNFEFYFKTKYLIPDGGQFILTFPTDFALDGSYPEATFSAPQFYSQSNTQVLSFSASANVLTVYNIKEHPASGPFTIIVKGVRSRQLPASASAKPFLAEIQLNSKTIVKTADLVNGFDKFDYGDAFTPGKVIFSSIQAFPNNQLESAIYTFTFVLTNELLEGGMISVNFPSSYYPVLPTPGVDCRCNITGGLTSFQSCRLIDSAYVIITDQRYQSGEIIFSINNILNPKKGTATPFTITSKYDGIFLDISDDNLPNSLEIYSKSEPVLVQSIEFYPRNEGEEAMYIFTFVPSTPIDSAYVVITFPQNYDQKIGNQITCSPYDCEVKDRQIWLSGITNYVPLGTAPLQVYVEGVINPNKNENDQFTSQFAIGVIKQNTFNYIDYNAQAGKLQISVAPGWAYLYTVIPQNTYSRWQNTTYQFTMTAKLLVPRISAMGSIIVDFPKQFDIPDGSKKCIGDLSFIAATCTSKSNSVTLQGNTVDVNGSISFNISDIMNPPDEITVDNMLVKTYDGFKQEIVEKSYKNLDPWVFSYVFPGPLITFNDDQPITVERGTQTKDMWLKVAYPCALNLIYSGIASSGLEVIPSKIKFNLGDLQQKFRISAVESMSPATYTITWSVSGEQSPPYYTPVKKSTVKVTNNKNIRIDVSNLNEIPIGGTSLDTLISVDYAPNLGMEILLSSLNQALILSTRSVQFISGQNNASFRVQCNETEYNRQLNNNELGSLSITLTLSGINQDVFILSQSQLDATIISKDTEQPFITGLITDQTTFTETNLILSSGEISVIYYMVALYGTASPTIKELMDLGPAQYTTTESQFNKISIGKTNTATVRIYNLKAQTPYIVYALAEDRGSLTSDFKNYQFWTTTRYNASSTTVYFKQSYLNQAERDTILTQIAFVLSLPPDKVIEKTTTTSSRLLQTQIGLPIYIISIPESENFPSPFNLVTELNKRQSQLSALVSNLDTSISYAATEFQPYVPSFVTTPINLNSTYYTCSVQGRLDQQGILYVISVKASTDTSSPYVQQVWWGYNSLNIPQPSAYIKVETPNVDYNITISDLLEDTDYNIYMIAGSAHPGYPDLTTVDSEIYLIPCRTLAKQATIYLNINGGQLFNQIVIVLAILLFQ